MRLYQILESSEEAIPCPFPASQVKDILYHGTSAKFSRFLRPAHGIYVTPWKDWATDHYGNGVVIGLYANVRKKLDLDPMSEEADAFYDMDYKKVSELIKKWSREGYNCCRFGGESESMVLFNNIEIVNAFTGEEM